NTVSDRTSLPARSVNVVTPSATVMMVIVAEVWPARTTPPVAVATAGLSVDTETGVLAAAGVVRICTTNTIWRPAAAMTCPALGEFEIARPTGLARISGVEPGGGTPTNT